MWDYDEESRPYRTYDEDPAYHEYNKKAFKEAQTFPILQLFLMAVVGLACFIFL